MKNEIIMNIKSPDKLTAQIEEIEKKLTQNRANINPTVDLSKRIFEVILAEKVTVDVAERALHRALLLVRSRTIVGP